MFDQKLSFTDHLENVKKRTEKLTTNLPKFSANTWGMSPSLLREIYVRNFERMIIYGFTGLDK